MTGQNPFGYAGDRGSRHADGTPGTQAVHLRTSVIPAIIIAVICVVAAVVGFIGNASTGALRGEIAGITCGALLILAVSIMTGNAISRQVTGQLDTLRMKSRHGQAEVQQLVEGALRGVELPVPPAPPAPSRVGSDDPFRQLAYELDRTQYAAAQAISQLTQHPRAADRGDQRVEIFVNLARRMQSLVHREIEMLDDLEAKVEDPELLKGLFTVDHLATRMRRQSESLAVLGGSSSRRQWTRQVSMHEVLRAAVAEIEQYSRVKIVPPVEGVLRGAAVADVIHLIAELVENATKFSAPRTQAMLRAQQVTAGVAIEIEDRGLGMLATDQQRVNAQLAEPGGIDIGELLQDGRIGLYVVSTLAHRHGIRVQLTSNIYGGTSAVVVLPQALLDENSERQLTRSSGPMRGGDQAAGTDVTTGSPVGASAGLNTDRELVTASAGPAAPALSPVVSPSVVSPSPAAPGPSGSPPWDKFPSVSGYAPAPNGYANSDNTAASYTSTDYTSTLFSSGTYSSGSAAYDASRQYDPAKQYDSAQPFATPKEYDAGQPPTRSSAYPPAQPQSGVPAAQRPPLPKRQVQASLAAELRDTRPVSAPGRRTEPAEDSMPGLMADFLRGVGRSDTSEDDDPGTDATAR